MLRIKIPAREYYDELTSEFVTIKEQTLVMEHSLISISKWESKWKKPYLSNKNKTEEEMYDYLRCMTISPSSVDPVIYRSLTKEALDSIADYINDSMTATKFNEQNRSQSREIITSEIIYYWMIAQNIPTEYEKWHLNRLMTLIRVCAIKNNPNQKKMSRSAIAKQNHAINSARRKKYGTKG